MREEKDRSRLCVVCLDAPKSAGFAHGNRFPFFLNEVLYFVFFQCPLVRLQIVYYEDMGIGRALLSFMPHACGQHHHRFLRGLREICLSPAIQKTVFEFLQLRTKAF